MAAPEGDVKAEVAAWCNEVGRWELEGSRDVSSLPLHPRRTAPSVPQHSQAGPVSTSRHPSPSFALSLSLWLLFHQSSRWFLHAACGKLIQTAKFLLNFMDSGILPFLRLKDVSVIGYFS